MNKFWSIGSVALAATALGVALFGGGSGPPAAAPAAPEPPHAQAEFRALERRVELLEESNSLLERKVFELSRPRHVVLEDGGQLSVAAPPPMTETPHGAPGSPGLPAPMAVPREELKEAVRAAQNELAAEQSKERLQRFEREQARAQVEQAERWKKFTTEANLNGAQEQALNSNLEAEAAKRKALLDEVRAGSKSFFEIRGDMREARNVTDQAMAKVLTEPQLQKYTEVRREERRGGPGGWQGGGSGGSGGPWGGPR
jgi:hypothetical protein